MGDIYYILFRQKWKIIACSAIGVLAAAALFVVRPPVYESEAKLLIRYVQDSKFMNPTTTDARVRSPDEAGNNIVNTEIEILRSFDLAQQVVDTVGAEKIDPKSRGAGNRDATATLVSKNLTVEVPSKGSVIRVVFQYRNREVVQPVLRELIAKYLKKHADIHQQLGVYDDFLTRQTGELKSQLDKAEQELQRARTSAGVLSLADTKQVYTDQISKLRQDLFNAQAELAEHQAALKDVPKPAPAAVNAMPSNIVVRAETFAGAAVIYRSLWGRLDLLWKKQQELLTQFTEQSVPVKRVREQIAEAEAAKRILEEKYPRLAGLRAAATGQEEGFIINPSTEWGRVAVLEAKIPALSSQLDQLRIEAINTAASVATIQELQRTKELEEANYRHFSASLEQSRFDEALGAGKVSNISVIQAPSPPFRAKSMTYGVMAGAILAGLCGGVALAFLIELKLDQSVRRPVDIESKLRIPLFLSIPHTGMNGHRRLREAAKGEPLLLKVPDGEVPEAAGNGSCETSHRPETAPWNSSPALNPFHEALRDRLIVDFEVRNLTHKPKLLAVTSCGQGAGVTTIAAGLAGCLSEAGDGNVLLVDMNREKAAAQQFWKGKSVCGLHEALHDAHCTEVQDNLFVVTEITDGGGHRGNLPRQFTSLVPKLKASNYDYIIFDMPPVSQTSVTPRLAGFVDIVVLVLESEKTDMGVARQAGALLDGSKAHVCAVLNKTQAHVPPRLYQYSLNNA